MKRKLDIGLGLSDAAQHLVKGKGKYLINCLFALALGILSSVYIFYTVFKKLESITYYDSFEMVDILMSEMVKLIPFYMVIGLISLCIQCVFIKIVDDVIEKRDLSYGEQFSYVLSRLGRIILANVITLLPIILISLLMFASMKNMFFMAVFPILFMTLVLVVYGMMLIFIDQSIIVDDASVLESIKRSFSVVSYNFFRILFTFILIGIMGAILAGIVGEGNLVLEIISSIINVIVSLYMTAFLTTLYKQSVTTHNNEDLEIEYFEDYE